MVSKDFIRVAKRIAKRGAKLGIIDSLIHLARGRVEVSDGHVLLSVDHKGTHNKTQTIDAAALKATHGATLVLGEEVVIQKAAEVTRPANADTAEWPDFASQWLAVEEPTDDYLPPFLVDPVKMIDALDAFRKDTPVLIHLPDAAGRPVVIEGSMYDGNGEPVPARALIMAGEMPRDG